MPRSIDEVVAWARANPLYTYKDGSGRRGSWSGLCEAFVNNAGDFDQSYSSALLAGNASGPLNPNWRSAPRGAIHYWAGVGGDGHVAFELGGGLLLMASSRVSNFGTAVGTIHFSDYGLPLYRGWTLRHGTQTLRNVAPAPAGAVTGAVAAPKPLPRKKSNMYLAWTTDGTGWLVTEDGWLGLGSPQVYSLFYRLINSNQATSPFHNGARPDTFLRAEVDIMNAQLRLLAVSVNTQTTIDPAKLASALSDALGKTLTASMPQAVLDKLDKIDAGVAGVTLDPADFHVEAKVSAEELAAAFDVAVPRIAAAVVKAAGAKLTS